MWIPLYLAKEDEKQKEKNKNEERSRRQKEKWALKAGTNRVTDKTKGRFP